MAAFADFMKKNAKFMYGGGVLGAAFVAKDAKSILDADNKFTALLKTMKEFMVIRIGMVGVFTAISAGVKQLVRDTGSLDAALKKLAQMQVFSRQFSTFAGGIDAARKRIAELAALSKREPFRFEDLVTTNKSLEIFTRGAYSSVEATKEIGKAALATGNDITDTARAVGNFYENLRSGRPVDQATELMRQMGLISESTAEHLNTMAEGGQNVSTVFDELKTSLTAAGAPARSLEGDLSNLSDEHEKLVEEMKTAFGAPFTAAEVENAKNYNAALKAFTPVVASVAKSSATLYGGFSTATSSLVKFAAQSKTVQNIAVGLGKSIQVASVAAAVYGISIATKLTPALLSMGAAGTTLGGILSIFGRFAPAVTGLLRIASVASVWGLVATATVGLATALYNLHKQAIQTIQDFKEWQNAHTGTLQALAAQTAAVRTLTQRNEVFAKTLDHLIELEKELADVTGETTKKQQAQREEELRRAAGIKPGAQKPGEPTPGALPEPPAAKTPDELKDINKQLKELEDRRKNISTSGSGVIPVPREVVKQQTDEIDKQITKLKERKKVVQEEGDTTVRAGKESHRVTVERGTATERFHRAAEAARKAGATEAGVGFAGLKAVFQGNIGERAAHAREVELRRQINAAKELLNLQKQQNPVSEQLVNFEVERRFAIEEQSKGVEQRVKAAKTGLDAESKAAEERGRIDLDITERQKAMAKTRQDFEEKGKATSDERAAYHKDIAAQQDAITKLEKQKQAAGLTTPGTAIFEETKRDKLEFARQREEAKAKLGASPKGSPERKALQEEIRRLTEMSGGVEYSETALREAEARARLARKTQEAGLGEAPSVPEVKRRGEEFERTTGAIEARATGDIRKAMKLEDLSKFATTFEQLMPVFGKEKAAELARERTGADIKEEYAQAGNVVGYLQSIGGGGGLPQQGVDLQRRLVELASSSNEYLKKMAEPEQTAAAQEGTPAFFFNP